MRINKKVPARFKLMSSLSLHPLPIYIVHVYIFYYYKVPMLGEKNMKEIMRDFCVYFDRKYISHNIEVFSAI